MKHYCLGFVISDRQVLLIRKNSGRMKGKTNGLGGTIEPNETPKQAISREVEEESAIYIAPEEWSHVATVLGGGWKMEVFVTLVKILYSDDSWQSSDEGEVSFYGLSNLPQNMDLTAKWLLQMTYDDTVSWPLTIWTNDFSPEVHLRKPEYEGQTVYIGRQQSAADMLTIGLGLNNGDTLVVPDRLQSVIENALVRLNGPDILVVKESDRVGQLREMYPGGRI